jgi:hypothetical protein
MLFSDSVGVCRRPPPKQLETSPSPLLIRSNKEPPYQVKIFALGKVSSGSPLKDPTSPAQESFQESFLETLFWQYAMSSSLKSLPEGLKNAECEKGTLPVRPPIPYVPPTDLHEKRETEQIKVKLPDGTKIKNNVVICDGRQFMSTVKDNLYTNKNIYILQISNLDSWVSDMKNPSLGLRLILPSQSYPVFICLPQSKSLGIMSNGKKICAAMHSCAQTQPKSISRGMRNHVFTDHDNKYYSIGAQPGRAEKGVQ